MISKDFLETWARTALSRSHPALGQPLATFPCSHADGSFAFSPVSSKVLFFPVPRCSVCPQQGNRSAGWAMWLPQGRPAPARAAPVQQLRFSSSRATQLRAKASPAGAGRSPLHFGWWRRVAKVRQRGGGCQPRVGTKLRWENPSSTAAKPGGIISLGLKKGRRAALLTTSDKPC